MRLRGFVLLSVCHKGRVIHREEGRNLVVTAGKNLIASIVGASGTKPTHFGFGSGSTSPAETDTTLVSEYSFGGYTRRSFTTSVSGNIVTYSAVASTWVNNSGGSLNLREIGIFNAASAGTLLARFLTTAITLAAGDELKTTWRLPFDGA